MAIPDIQHILDLLQRGDTAEVVPMLSRRAEQVPANVTTYLLLALVHEAEGRWEEALAAWQAAYFLMPNSPVVEAGQQRTLAALAASPAGGIHAAAPKAVPAEEAQEGAGGAAAYEDPVGAAPLPEEEALVDLTRQPEASPPPELEEEPEAAPGAEAEEAAEEVPASWELGWGARAPDDGEGEDEEDVASEAAAVEEKTFDDLDRLIEELESARIVPGPDFESVPAPDLEDEIEDVVSETLARIYAAQQQFDEAARVYELLAAQQPGHAEAYLRKAAEMRARATEE